ncbi:MAG TPA: PAS domain S-box protein [Acidobacteriota bacterium]|jgi:hypothetical protein
MKNTDKPKQKLIQEVEALQGRVAQLELLESQRKKTEEALRHSEAMFRDLYDDAPIGYHEIDTQGRITRVNRSELAMLGYSAEEMLGRPVWNFLQEKGVSIDAIAAKISGSKPLVSFERTFIKKNGTPVPVLLEDRLIRDADRNVIGIRTTVQDISARKRVEEALRNSEMRTRSVIEHMLEGLITLNEEGIIESMNSAAEHMFGYKSEELVSKHLKTLLFEPNNLSDRDFTKSVIDKALGRVSEWEARRKDERTFPIELVLSEFHVPEGRRFVGNIRDVSERREVDRLKREFVSTVSHELRTPLTSIRGSLSLLAGGALGRLPEEAAEVVALAERNTIRLITLINDILDLERLESGKLEMHFDTIPLETVLRRSAEAVHAFADQEGITLEIPSSPSKVFGDGDRLVQVLVNLLSNGIKFSPKSSRVSIAVHESTAWVEIRVTDRGRGIPASHKRVIFERFRQVEASDSRQKGGTGLGLAICKAIVEQHGGTIGVDSEEGGGSTFWIRIPSVVKRREIVQRKAEMAHKSISPILIGDDDPEMQHYFEVLLRKEGHAVVFGKSAEETWAILQRSQVSLAILDTVLLENSGAEILEKLRRDPRFTNLPIIIVGDKVLLSAEELSNNVAVFLPKPIQEDQLLAAIRDSLARAGGTDVLLVEDDQTLLNVMERQLCRDGITVRTATTGREAIQLAQDRPPGLLVLDVGLPEGDGFDVVDALRKQNHLKRIPLLVYTGRDLTAEQRGLLTLGATRFLTKSEATDEEFQSLVVTLLQKSIESGSQV